MNTPNPSLLRKSAARLAAVQCLYQAQFAPAAADQLIVDRMGMEGEDMESEMLRLPAAPEPKLLRGIVTGTLEQRPRIDSLMWEALAERMSDARMNSLLTSLLAAATYELVFHPKLKTPVILSEYTNLAGYYYEDTEIGFVNAALEALARACRNGDKL